MFPLDLDNTRPDKAFPEQITELLLLKDRLDDFPNTSDNVLGLMKTTSREFHQTIVMITHNPDIAQPADETIRIVDGRIA